MNNCYGEKLITIGGIIASEIAQSTDIDTLGILAALFTVIGDQLALLSLTKGKSKLRGE